MYSDAYKEQFSLLLKVLPCLIEQDDFVIKGGTAINLFYRDLPRISVDIDLTYAKIENRALTLKHMDEVLMGLENWIARYVPGVVLKKQFSKRNEHIAKIMIISEKSVVKIEPNYIFRGYLFKPERLPIANRVIQEFGGFIDNVPVASFYDVYAGKICAALNRQHPRDLFDIKFLFDNEGISDKLRQAFVVHLACDARPMNELLNPHRLDISSLYSREFNSMTADTVELSDLINTREHLIDTILNSLTSDEKDFLLSVKEGSPDYSLLPFESLCDLPALKWKVINIQRMAKSKRTIMFNKLKGVLS